MGGVTLGRGARFCDPYWLEVQPPIHLQRNPVPDAQKLVSIGVMVVFRGAVGPHKRWINRMPSKTQVDEA